jgi:hypothetical protein
LRAADLFDDFAACHARGERPDAREYLERAGKGADELAGLIDAYLRSVPAGKPAPETVAMMQAFVEGEPPLLRLRVERRLTRDAVVDALVKGLKLDFKKTPKVSRYYHELETGLLDPARVDDRVFAVLAKTLGARVVDLVASRSARLQTKPAYFRSPLAAPAPVADLDLSPVEAERDEIDLLFNASR